MTNFIPIFPLGVVVYPGQQLNLHIFEDRYVQLINECWANKKSFGLPVVLESGITEFGTLVEVEEMVEKFEDGKMNIRTRGKEVFRMLEIVETIPDKLYRGAIVSYPENDTTPIKTTTQKLVEMIRNLHRSVQVQKEFAKPDADLISYDIAHHTGLSLKQEYELLQLLKEKQRLEYLKRHLQKVIPIMQQVQQLKERVQLNGHFRKLSN
jgi:uncharacterized protein